MQNKYSLTNIIAVMSVYLFATGMMIVNPTIQKLVEAYPDIPLSTIKMVSTLPSLISSGVMILIGYVVGSRMKYKTVLQWSMVCLLVGGLLPIFWNSSFWAVLFARGIYGLGMGGIGCRNALTMASFDANDSARFLGYGIFVSNVGGVLMQIICGYLADISLRHSYLVYLIAIIPLVLITMFLKEPEHTAKVSSVQEKPKVEINKRLWLYVGIGFFWCLIGYSIMTNMSTFIQNKGLGTATVAGSILSLYTLGGAVGGAISAKWYQLAKRFFVPMAFAVAAVGELLVLIGLNIPMIALGTALAGFGWFALNPHIMRFSGIVSGKDSAAFGSSITLAATQVGVFMSSYVTAIMGYFFEDAIIATKYVAIIGFALCAVIFLIYDARPIEERGVAKKAA